MGKKKQKKSRAVNVFPGSWCELMQGLDRGVGSLGGREGGVILERQRCFDSGREVPELWAQVWLPTMLGWVYQSVPYWDKQKPKQNVHMENNKDCFNSVQI